MYSTKADIWSLGVILYEMLYGVCPFQTSSVAMLISSINNKLVEFSNDKPITENVQTAITRMLTKDYFRRIGWVELFGLFAEEKPIEQKRDFNSQL